MKKNGTVKVSRIETLNKTKNDYTRLPKKIDTNFRQRIYKKHSSKILKSCKEN